MYTTDVNSTVGQVVNATNNVARARAVPGSDLDYEMMLSTTTPTLGKSSSAQDTDSVSIDNAGGGLSHPNYQPALATNYIIYIP
jgi:microcystin-dependent protein